MYSKRKGDYDATRPDDVVESDDILTLYAHHLVGDSTMPMIDGGLEKLAEIVSKIAPDYIVTLYVRQYELIQRMRQAEKALATIMDAKGE